MKKLQGKYDFWGKITFDLLNSTFKYMKPIIDPKSLFWWCHHKGLGFDDVIIKVCFDDFTIQVYVLMITPYRSMFWWCHNSGLCFDDVIIGLFHAFEINYKLNLHYYWLAYNVSVTFILKVLQKFWLESRKNMYIEIGSINKFSKMDYIYSYFEIFNMSQTYLGQFLGEKNCLISVCKLMM